MSLRERLALSDPERPTGAESHDAPNQAYQELKFYVRIHQNKFEHWGIRIILKAFVQRQVRLIQNKAKELVCRNIEQ